MLAAEQAKKKNIKKAVFDRAGKLYHGRVQAIADGAREGGIEVWFFIVKFKFKKV